MTFSISYCILQFQNCFHSFIICLFSFCSPIISLISFSSLSIFKRVVLMSLAGKSNGCVYSGMVSEHLFWSEWTVLSCFFIWLWFFFLTEHLKKHLPQCCRLAPGRRRRHPLISPVCRLHISSGFFLHLPWACVCRPRPHRLHGWFQMPQFPWELHPCFLLGTQLFYCILQTTVSSCGHLWVCSPLAVFVNHAWCSLWLPLAWDLLYCSCLSELLVR